MARYRVTYPKDQASVPDGDAGFVGVNMRVDPGSLPAGIAAEAVNCRFDRGVMEPRLGIMKLGWSNQQNAQDAIIPYAKVWGTGVFSDPNETEWIIVAADDKVYATREDNTSREIPLPAGVTIDSDVFFVQALNELIMMRGSDKAPLKMTDVAVGFETVTQSDNTITGVSSENPQDGTQAIPNSDQATYLANRLFVPHSRDLVSVSDYLNFTRYHPVRSQFRVNQGSHDKLVALFKFNETTLIAAKEQSIYLIYNVRGNLSGAVLDELTREYGCKAAKSFAQVGSDVWFLADRRGVTSITQTDQNQLQAVDLPVSDALQPIIDRINWDFAENAVAAWHNNRYYLAVPLDNARVEKGDLLAGQSYDASGQLSVTVKKGQRYLWEPGANDATLVNGTETLFAEGEFVAQGSTVTIQGGTVLLSDSFASENGGASAVGYTGFTNWDVAGAVDLVGSDWTFDGLQGQFPDRVPYVDLRGSLAGSQSTGLDSKTVFTFTQGKRYTVKFRYAGNNRNSAITNELQVSVKDGGFFSQAITAIASNTPFTDKVYEFTWTPATDTGVLRFRDIDQGDDNIGVLLDDVSLLESAAVAVSGTLKPVYTGVNNTVLVYSFLNRAWSGYDQAAPIMVQEWVKHTYNGVNRLFFLSNDGFLNLYEEGFEDETADQADAITYADIEQELLTRGYTAESQDFKLWQRWEAHMATWNPTYSIQAIFDGVNETKSLRTDQTRSRTLYRKPFDAAAYDVTNTNDDHATAFREDYSVEMTDGNTTLSLGTNGIDSELHQEIPDEGHIYRRARHCQLKFTTSQGRLKVRSVNIYAQPGQRREGAKI